MKKCDCAVIYRPLLVESGNLDPPEAGWICPVCKKQWHRWFLSDEYLKKISNMAKSYHSSVPVKIEERWLSQDEVKSLYKIYNLDIKSIKDRMRDFILKKK